MYAYLVYYILGFVMIPGIILGVVAQSKVVSTFNEFNSTPTKKGKTAREVVALMLNGAGFFETKIGAVKGDLTDYYDPQKDVVALSDSVRDNNSISAIGVAAHEVGHVFQHKQNYAPVKIRSAMVPVLNISQMFMWPMIVIGLIFEVAYYATWATVLIYIGLAIYALNTIFCLITLPVELNASKRAYKMLVATNEMTEEEANCAKKVLNAAAYTYVAGLITSILSLIRVILFIFAMRGDRK